MAMAPGKKRSKGAAIPAPALEHLCNEIRAIRDPDLDVTQNGRFCYVTHAGQPLCRLGYRGEVEIWDFAIYRPSRQAYSTSFEIFPLFGKVGECVRKALDAYNLM